jgi:AcrR family transcriptional regulator
MTIAREETQDAAPRERIIAAARELFYRHGIRNVGVDAIAEAASTNKMTLYRHFESKDLLVVEYLRVLSDEAEAVWQNLARTHAGKPLRQIEAWIAHISAKLAGSGDRGCAIANAAVELPEKDHPARAIISRHKTNQRDNLARLSHAVGFADPERVADEIFLLLEGARVNIQSVGRGGPGGRFKERALACLKSARRKKS